MRYFHITIRVDRNNCKESELLNFIAAGSLLAPLPSNSPSPKAVAKSYTTHSHKNKKDYRRGLIRIEWVDFKAFGAKMSTSAGKEKEIRRSTSVSLTHPIRLSLKVTSQVPHQSQNFRNSRLEQRTSRKGSSTYFVKLLRLARMSLVQDHHRHPRQFHLQLATFLPQMIKPLLLS